MVAPTPIKPVAPALPSLGKAHTHQTNHEDRDDQAKLPVQMPGCGEPQVQVQQGADPADHQ